jgi:NADPH:quinone reductase-like Zn-dependent oxidoreductase
MKTHTTEAWVLYRSNGSQAEAAELKKEVFTFSDITAEEVLVEPIYGCWEANMTHVLQRWPIDICQQRREDKVVLGNAGVVRVLKIGSAVTAVKEEDLCIVFCNSVWDKHGYTLKVLAYDAPNTMGILAKQAKLPQRCLIPIPAASSHSLEKWAAFSLRYVTAWANWHVAFNCWRVQMPDVDPSAVHVWGWGGGVTFAELTFAKAVGCQTAMIASSDPRLQLIAQTGIHPIDRRQFEDLAFDGQKYRIDPSYRARYLEAEKTFLTLVEAYTEGNGVSIFIDNIGLPVLRPTLKSLARQGVITTCGWKCGMEVSNLRALECINRHIHVHTHYARYQEGLEAIKAAEAIDWLAPLANDKTYQWNEIPQLAEDYAAGRIDSYFPIFQVN